MSRAIWKLANLAAGFALCLAVLTFLPDRSVAKDTKHEQMYSEATDAYFKGEYEIAFEIYTKVAENGHALAQYALGWMHQYGLGTKVDYKEAYKWLHKAALQGVARAQYNLGYMYHHGWGGVEEDMDEASKWYRLAADQGNSFAEYEIGWMYYYGQGLPINIDMAISFYEKAAAKNFNRAINTLGSIYFNGTEVEQDYVSAYMWWTIALTTAESAPDKQTAFLEEVNASLTKVKALMSSSQIAQAKKQAAKRMGK